MKIRKPRLWLSIIEGYRMGYVVMVLIEGI